MFFHFFAKSKIKEVECWSHNRMFEYVSGIVWDLSRLEKAVILL
jgi:hypothetical protein